MNAYELDVELTELTANYVEQLDRAASISNDIMRLLIDARIDTELRADEDYNPLFRDYVTKLETVIRMADSMTATAAKFVKNPR